MQVAVICSMAPSCYAPRAVLSELRCLCLQGRDYWARFERFVKTLAWSNDDVYIITGPLYVPQRTPQGYVMHHPMIGMLCNHTNCVSLDGQLDMRQLPLLHVCRSAVHSRCIMYQLAHQVLWHIAKSCEQCHSRHDTLQQSPLNDQTELGQQPEADSMSGGSQSQVGS